MTERADVYLNFSNISFQSESLEDLCLTSRRLRVGEPKGKASISQQQRTLIISLELKSTVVLTSTRKIPLRVLPES